MRPKRKSPKKMDLKWHVFQTVFVTLIVVFSQGVTFGQSHQTENTLKLDQPTQRPTATLADVGLLVGHWKGEFLGSMAEELWLPPAGGSMLGVFRLFKEDTVRFYEIMTIVEEGGSIALKLKHFHSDLKGWEEKDGMVTFHLVKATKDTVWFEGLTYHKHEDGTLRGFIAILHEDGTEREHSFTLQPVGNH